jgi:hypothetical protein
LLPHELLERSDSAEITEMLAYHLIQSEDREAERRRARGEIEGPEVSASLKKFFSR